MSILVRMSDRLRRRSRRFRKNERGAVTVDFVLWFPMFFVLFLSSVEAGFILAKSIMLDRGLDLAVRNIRLGIGAMDHETIKNTTCANAIIIPDCQNSLRLEMSPVTNVASWTPSNNVVCVDRANPIDPAVTPVPPGYARGIENQLMLVRACAFISPIFPSSGLGLSLPKHPQSTNEFAIVSTSAFVNEPGT